MKIIFTDQKSNEAKRHYFRDLLSYIYSSASGILHIISDFIYFGSAGDVTWGDSTLREHYPQTDLKINIGKTTNRVNAAHIHQLHIQQSVANVSSPPTDAELDSAFGTPATLGRGFVGTVDDNDADTTVWLCMTTDAGWYYVATTKAT